MKRKLLVFLACGLLIGFLISPAQAVLMDYTFAAFDGHADPLDALGQTHMLVTNEGLPISGYDIGFKFTIDISPAVITDIGFYDGSILGTVPVYHQVDSGSGVLFSVPGVEIPGAKGYFGQAASLQFSTSADSPAPFYGVSAGEYLWVLFNLASGKTAQDVINALNAAIADFGPYSGSNPFPDGGLAVALKLQSVGANGYSTEGVNVPLPPSVLLMGSGLLGIGLLGYRRRKS